jgi:CubicO group peptidase (beta-lactamase class C family)
VKPQGFVKAGFEPVRDAFVRNFEQGLELGASAAVTLDGEPVVDLWAGDADLTGAPWERDTIVNVYSTTKTMAAACVLLLADRGQLDLDAPVAQYWPEFAQAGKEGVRVSHVMSHSAGLSGFDPPLEKAEELYDWEGIVGRLERQSPWWEPGTASGYHAVTQGYLQGEIVRRVTGRSIGTFFREEIATPLGADFHIGIDPAAEPRRGRLQPSSEELGAGQDPKSIGARTMRSCPLAAEDSYTEEWARAEIPAAGGTGNARSVARVHSALACGGSVDGVRLMGSETVERVLEVQTDGTDLVLGQPLRFGMGFGLSLGGVPISPNERAFFWGGWGGSLAIIDLDARVSIAYVMNRMQGTTTGDVRAGSIVMAAYRSLAG